MDPRTNNQSAADQENSNEPRASNSNEPQASNSNTELENVLAAKELKIENGQLKLPLNLMCIDNVHQLNFETVKEWLDFVFGEESPIIQKQIHDAALAWWNGEEGASMREHMWQKHTEKMLRCEKYAAHVNRIYNAGLFDFDPQ